MHKERAGKKPKQADNGKKSEILNSPDFEKAVLDEASRDFSFQIDRVQIAASGAIFITGWADDRASRLSQIRMQGQAWSKTVETQHIGRHRRRSTDLSSASQRSHGFWALTTYDRSLIYGKTCAIELILTNGTSKNCDVGLEYIGNEEFRGRFAKFWAESNNADRSPPMELTYVEQALKRPAATVAAVMPKHNVENVTVADEGGAFVNGWIDDTNDQVEAIDIVGNSGRVSFAGGALARTFREDVQTALGLAKKHEFGFWSFAANGLVQRAGGNAGVEFKMASGARQRQEISVRGVDQIELRNVALTYLAASQYLGNPKLAGAASLESAIGEQIIDLNQRIAGKIASAHHVERFGQITRPLKGSIIVCLYGKPEYFFLQNALFAGRPGIEDYEFIYVCNSPELAEPLLREARIASFAYGLPQTLIILPSNAGFGAANNVAAGFASSDRVLFVNPDVFPLDQDWAAKHTRIVEQLPKEQTDLFGVPLYYDDGSLMHGGMYFEIDRGLSVERASFKSMNFLRVEHYGKGAPPLTESFIRPRAVAAVTGAFMSINRTWFETIGGFSEEYVFGHYEDADLCLKSIDKGVTPWIHDIKLWHLEGKGSHRLPVHEGASVVNRWLFNKRWVEKLVPDMLGQSPILSLARPTENKLESRSYLSRERIAFSNGKSPNEIAMDKETILMPAAGRKVAEISNIEIVFDGL